MSWPASSIEPAVGVSRPATIRSVVVLPQPDGPSSAMNEPRGTSRSRSLTAVKAPNDFVTLRSRSPSYDSESALSGVDGAWSATCDIVELSLVGSDLLLGQRHEVEGDRQGLVVGEDQLVVDQGRIDLLHLLLGTLDGADVVDPGGELRGVGLVGREVGHHHVVAPERQSLLRRDELDVRVVELGLDDVAGPGLAGD